MAQSFRSEKHETVDSRLPQLVRFLSPEQINVQCRIGNQWEQKSNHSGNVVDVRQAQQLRDNHVATVATPWTGNMLDALAV
jgi:hypothetical protein